MKRYGKFLLLCSFLPALLPAAPLRAAGAGTTGANFLKIQSAVIPASMAGAYTAMVSADSQLYNPAGLGLLSYSAFSGSHNQYLVGITQEYAALAVHTHYGVLGAAFSSLSSGDVAAYDANDMPLGSVKATQRVASVSYSKSWPYFKADAGKRDPMLLNNGWTRVEPVRDYRQRSYRVSAGVTAKRISENLAGEAASAQAFDAGLLVLLPRHLHVGVSAQNFGGRQKFHEKSFDLPSSLRAGLAKDFRTVNDVLIFTLTSDMVKYADAKALALAGLEVDVRRIFQLRFGYESRKDAGGRLSAGLGMNFDRLSDKDSLVKGLRADYAFVDYGDLGATHRIGLQFIW